MAKRSREDSPPARFPDPSPPSPSPSPSVDEPQTPPTSDAVDDIRSTKYFQTSSDALDCKPVAMKCSLPPHPTTLTFPTFTDFEVHYAQTHSNRCSSCQKNLPTAHFLDLHIRENHDPLVAARRAREEKTYRCFVEDCDKVCSNPQKRRMHLQAKHSFPKDYDYFIVNDGIDKRSSMLRTRHRRGSSAASRAVHRGQKRFAPQDANRDAEPTGNPREELSHRLSSGEDDAANSASQAQDIDDLTSTMSALQFVPLSVRFGRGGGRATGLARH
ncbi:MAG: hypothetical protein Q9207_001441 [Kuettlingeria erythrocarpa]